MTRPLAHFLHIGKTGGTAVRAALAPFETTHRLCLHGHGFTLRDVPRDETAFFFLRDPASRFVSAFNSRLRQGRPRWDRPWSAEEQWAFQRFGTPNDLAEALGSGEADRAMAGIRHVNAGYADWLVSAPYALSRNLAFVGRQERLDADFEVLKAALGLPDLELPTDPVARHATPAGLSTHLSKEGRERLRAWYAPDYVLLEVLCPQGL